MPLIRGTFSLGPSEPPPPAAAAVKAALDVPGAGIADADLCAIFSECFFSMCRSTRHLKRALKSQNGQLYLKEINVFSIINIFYIKITMNADHYYYDYLLYLVSLL